MCCTTESWGINWIIHHLESNIYYDGCVCVSQSQMVCGLVSSESDTSSPLASSAELSSSCTPDREMTVGHRLELQLTHRTLILARVSSEGPRGTSDAS